MKKIISAMLIITMVVGLSSCSFTNKYTKSYIGTFDTNTTLVAYLDDKATFERASELVKAKLELYSQLFDCYTSYDGVTNIKTLNDSQGAPVKVGAEVLDIMEYGQWSFMNTKGQLNVAIGTISNLWKDYRDKANANPSDAAVPTEEELKVASEHINVDDIFIDHENSTITLLDPEMKIDLGALAKGYTADKIASSLEAMGVKNFALNIGGNVITKGTKPDGKPFTVSIQKPAPNAEKETIYDLSITDLSVVTSGNYERFYKVGDKIYNHIIDPDTLYPTDLYKSITIVSPGSLLSDCMSTALYNMTIEEGREFLKGFPTVEVLWVFNDDSTQTTNSFYKYYKK